MTKKEWIIGLLKDNDYNAIKVYSYYNEGIKLGYFDKTYPLSTFKRRVRDYRLEIVNNTLNKEIIEKNIEVDSDKLKLIEGFLNNNDFDTIDTLLNLNDKLTSKQINKIQSLLENIDTKELDLDEILNIKSYNTFLKDKINKLKKEIHYLHKNRFENKEVINSLRSDINTFESGDTFNINVNIKTVNNNLNNILLLSDLHYGETVVGKHINNINNYDCDIAKKRLVKLFTENLKICKYTGSNKLYIFMLGDILSGIIHEELLENSEKTITELIVDLFSFFSKLLLEYSKEFDFINISCVVGNHGRLGDVKFKNKAQTNFEYIFYKFLEDKFINDKKIKINVSESPVMICDVDKLRCKIEHGDNYRTGGNFLNLPLMAISRDSIKEKTMLTKANLPYDITFMGHYHTPAISWGLDNTINVINPSIIGGNEYSVNKLHSAFRPSQFSLISDEKEIKNFRLIYLD